MVFGKKNPIYVVFQILHLTASSSVSKRIFMVWELGSTIGPGVVLKLNKTSTVALGSVLHSIKYLNIKRRSLKLKKIYTNDTFSTLNLINFQLENCFGIIDKVQDFYFVLEFLQCTVHPSWR